jgi:hypothetical protein
MGEKNMTCGLSENLEILINQLSEEQKQQQKTTNDLVQVVNHSAQKTEHLENKIELIVNENLKRISQTLEQKLDNFKNSHPHVDTNPLQEILQKGITEVKLMLSAYPKSITRKMQILLFPEQDAKLFYKIVFGRWFLWLALMLLLSLTYKWMIHREDNNKQVMMEALKNDKITKAWDYLYRQKNRELHRLMDSALKKTAISSQ